MYMKCTTFMAHVPHEGEHFWGGYKKREEEEVFG
jgi:hypothetical protein